MEELYFDSGIKTYKIKDKYGNVRGEIHINTTDFNFFQRVENAKENISKLLEEVSALSDDMEQSYIVEIINKTDIKIKEEINVLFDDQGASEAIFGNQNVLNTLKGVTFVERFLETILPVIRADFEAEEAASRKRIASYTDQIKDHKKPAATKTRKKQS